MLFCVGFGAKRSFAQDSLTDFEAVDTYISTRMRELGIPGAALVIVQGDHIAHLKAFGVADASGRLVTPQTPFFTGSTGKSFTALAIMQLVETGKIQLDEPLKTLGEFDVQIKLHRDVNTSVKVIINREPE